MRKHKKKNGQNDPVNISFRESAEVNLFIVLLYDDVYQIHYSMTETKPYTPSPHQTARRCFVAPKIFIKSS